MRGWLINTVFVVLCCVAALLYWQNQKAILKDRGQFDAVSENGVVFLFWRGEIRVPMVSQLEAAFAQWETRTRHFVLDLDSPGGALREGNRVIDLIGRIQKTHKLDTRVGARRICLSMCVPIFLQGQNRIASSSSQWMFHEPRRINYFTGEEGAGLEVENRFFAERFFDRYFVNSPINPEWRDQLRQAWKGQEVWRSGQQLFEERSNIITELR